MMSPSAEADRWIHRFSETPGSKITLIFFPHAGGSASYYYPFAAELAPEIDVRAVQYPGRQERRRERLIDNIADISDQAYAALQSWDRGPFAFFGHSMGAVVAAEVARRFQREGDGGPCWLFISGRRAPSCGRDSAIHLRDDDAMLAELRKVGGTDSRILDSVELRDLILRVTRNDYKAIETYQYPPGPPLTCPITVLVGDSDPQVTTEEAAAWAGYSTAEFDLQIFPGGHFYLETCRAEVTAAIIAALSNVCPGQSAGAGIRHS